jgi:chaperone LolA
MRRIIIVTIAVVFAFGTAESQSTGKTKLTATEVLEKVEEMCATVNDASAEFTQTVFFKYAKVEQSFSGTVSMKKKNKYRVESQQQTLVTDGATVWAYSPVNNQVLIDTYRESPNTFSPEKFLVGLPKNFRAAIVDDNTPEGHDATVLKLLPKSDVSKFVKSLKVWINDNDWSVRRVEYIDLNETRTVYSLKSITFNNGISDERFAFKVPEKTEVVDLRSVEQKLPHQ